MRTRKIGQATVSAIGLGGMPMSIEGRPDEDRSIRTIHAALDAGVTLIDTADAYHLLPGETGHNERLIAKALASYSGDASDVLVATRTSSPRPSAPASLSFATVPPTASRSCPGARSAASARPASWARGILGSRR